MSVQTVEFDLRITADDWLAYYRGTARYVVTRSLDGRRVRFPARLLHRYLDHSGIYGRFRLHYDAEGHSHGLERLD